MPFISSLRKNYDVPVLGPSTEEQFEITGGDAIITAGGYKIHMFTSVGEAEFNIKQRQQTNNAMALQTASLDAEYLVLAGGGAGG